MEGDLKGPEAPNVSGLSADMPSVDLDVPSADVDVSGESLEDEHCSTQCLTWGGRLGR